ncbi:MAG: hypothetical protein QXR96_01265, partial [Candidatus Woesearchaeota archaeon]
MPRISEFDGLRGLTAFFIMLGHYTSRFSEIYPEYNHSSKILINITFQLALVYMFFLLSGFFISFSISKKEAFSFLIS